MKGSLATIFSSDHRERYDSCVCARQRNELERAFDLFLDDRFRGFPGPSRSLFEKLRYRVDSMTDGGQKRWRSQVQESGIS
jgi:hypothetical protein